MGENPVSLDKDGGLQPAGGGSRRWWVRPLRWAAIGLGLVCVGAAGTYLVAPPVAAPQKVIELKAPTDSVVGGAQGAASMPSVLGLSMETVRVVLRDAGADGVKVVTKTKPGPGPVGRVIAQDPPAGQSIDKQVTLTTSTAMAMPPVVGKDFTQVRATLVAEGAVVRTQLVVQPGAKIGTVLSSVPVAGATMPTVITLGVADPGQALALSDLTESTSADCGRSSGITFGGTDSISGITCNLTQGAVSSIEFSMTGKALSFAFTLGYDTKVPGSTATVRILGDGRPLATFPVADSPTKRQVDITGVNVLRVEVSGVPAGADTGTTPVVALGNAIVQGVPASINALAPQ
ncbi:MAG: PASTA domain-containing protein [Mycobacteriaceae bacterium]